MGATLNLGVSPHNHPEFWSRHIPPKPYLSVKSLFIADFLSFFIVFQPNSCSSFETDFTKHYLLSHVESLHTRLIMSLD
jgi:hypothetical protein